MSRAMIALVTVGFAGCGVDPPTGTQQPEPAFTVAGQSGCYSVVGHIAQAGLFPSFAGTISGDVEGTVSTQGDPGSLRVAGVVVSASATQTWQVSGGSIPALIGRTIQLAIESETVFAQPPLARVNNRAKVIDGAASGRLTYHGTFDTTFPPPFETNVEYRGNICP